jgi:hypothetical protein
MCVAMRSRNQRSWLMMTAQPAKSSSARSVSDFGEIQPTLDTLYPAVEPVHSVGNIGVLAFQRAKAAFDFTNIVAHAVQRGPHVAQMLKNDILAFSHGTLIA